MDVNHHWLLLIIIKYSILSLEIFWKPPISSENICWTEPQRKAAESIEIKLSKMSASASWISQTYFGWRRFPCDHEYAIIELTVRCEVKLVATIYQLHFAREKHIYSLILSRPLLLSTVGGHDRCKIKHGILLVSTDCICFWKSSLDLNVVEIHYVLAL